MFSLQSNPIRERVQRMLLQWEQFTAQPDARMARWLAQPDEGDMVELFVDYLCAADSASDDIPLVFSTPFVSLHDYSHHLLSELATMIRLWNQTERDEKIEFEAIDWTVPQTGSDTNPAAGFVRSFNELATHLAPPEGCFLVAVLQPSSIYNTKEFNTWLQQAIKTGISDKVRFLILDDAGQEWFGKAAVNYPEQIQTLHPRLNMSEATRQLAALGDPTDPGTHFRQAYVALSDAIAKRDAAKTQKQAGVCLEIARAQIPVQPYWYAMEITVLSALANDQIGYSDYDKALAFAQQSIQVAGKAKEKIKEPLIAQRLLAQAYMLHAGLCVVKKDWLTAQSGYEQAAQSFGQVNDDLLAMEAFRMGAYAADKAGQSRQAVALLVSALDHGDQLPGHTVAHSTYPGVVEQLLSQHYPRVISTDELDKRVSRQLGPDWIEHVHQWRSSNRQPVVAQS